MQQDRAGAEFRHGAYASTLPSPEQNPPGDVKEKKKKGKKIPARGYFMEK